VVGLTLNAAACNAAWGIDDLRFTRARPSADGGSGGTAGQGAAATGGEATGGGGAGGAGHTGGDGAGGAGGSAVNCAPGSVADCYTGPESTRNVGECHDGQWQCNESGTGYSACEQEVTPGVEICGNDYDEDCNGAAEAECLATDGLLVRYYIDEASTGQAPTALLDAAASPLALPISYSNALSYYEVAGNRGLYWDASGSGGVASVALDGTKVWTALHGARQATIEAVVDVEEAYSGGSSSVLRIGPAGSYTSELRLGVDTGELAICSISGSLDCGEWDVEYGTGRMVLHLVIDTDQQLVTNRARLYRNGVLQTPVTAPANPAAGTTLDLTGSALGLGNRPTGATSLRGGILYAALYSQVLSPSAISQNVDMLSVSDDRP
jgi:hypothetical protein